MPISSSRGVVSVTTEVNLDKRFEQYIKEQLDAYTSLKLKELLSSVEDEIKYTIRRGIFDSPEFISLTSNGSEGKPTLREELGIVNPGEDIAKIVNAIIAAMKFEIRPADSDSLGVLYIGAFYEDYSDALSSGGAEYPNTGPAGGLIKWLQWMLLEGSGVIIKGYELLYDYPNRKINSRSASRTGKAIMIKRDYVNRSKYNARFGRTGPGSWSMPQDFAGTAENNWFTKVIEKISPDIERLMEERAKAIFA